jgi:hypothetical protein
MQLFATHWRCAREQRTSGHNVEFDVGTTTARATTAGGVDGGTAQFELTWIGRYILNGMAIADEFHSLAPDGSPYLGISIRHFDAKHDSWIIEYLNDNGESRMTPRDYIRLRRGRRALRAARMGWHA